MRHHSQNLVVFIVWERAHDLVLSSWQESEVTGTQLQIVHLQLSILVGTFAYALGQSLLKQLYSVTQDIFLIYRIDEFTIIEFRNVTNLIILWEYLEIHFKMNLKIIFQFHFLLT